MTRDNNKLRAIFLASLMFFWLFAGTVAFAGGAAATGDVAVEEISLSDDASGADGVTYTVDFSVSEDTDIRYVSVDLSDAEGIDLSEVDDDDVEINDDGGTNVEADSVTIDGDTVIVEADGTQTVGDAETWNVVISDVGNPEAGTYDLTLGLHDEDNGEPAAAKTTDTDTFTVGTGFERSDADGTWTSGDTAFQGQQLYFENTFDNLRSFELREFDGEATTYDGQVGSLEKQFTPDEDGVQIIDTSDLEGDYVITARGDDDRRAVVTDEDGVSVQTTRTPADDSAAIEVALQDLDAEFEDDSIRLGGTSTVDTSSNRAGFDLEITSDDLSVSDVASLFPAASDEGDFALVEDLDSDDSVEFNTTGADFLDAGETYDFDFDVTDTTASASDNITIGEELVQDAEFDEAIFQETQGDNVTIGYEVDGDVGNTTLIIGDDDDAGYEATLEIEPDDERVELEYNTFTAGNHTGAEEGTFEVTTGTLHSDYDDINETQLSRVLAAGLYDLAVENEDGDELDVAALELSERETGDMTIHTAPHADFGSLSEQDRLYELIDEERVTEGDEIARAPSERSSVRGDVVIHQVDVSGIEGAPGIDSVGDLDDSDFFNLTIDQQNPAANRAPKSLNVSASEDADAFHLHLDTDNDTVFVVARSDRLQFDREGDTDTVRASIDDELESEFVVREEYTSLFVRGEGAEETANNTFTMVDREADFDTQGGEVVVPPEEDAEITGETTVAPGTELNVRARATGESPFLKSARDRVAADGTFAAEFDFSDVEAGQEFTATITRQSFADDAETPGVVGDVERAAVSISDQEAVEQADEIVVDSVFVPDGGFVTIHDGTLLDGAVFDSVRGTSEFLDEGEHSDVTVALDDPYTEDGTAIAMPHRDTNDNQEYDFVETEGEEDGPYTDADGEAITDDASVTITEPTPTPTETPEDTPTPTEPDETPTEEPPEDQAGFGAVIALIALLGAALLAARRNAF